MSTLKGFTWEEKLAFVGLIAIDVSRDDIVDQHRNEKFLVKVQNQHTHGC